MPDVDLTEYLENMRAALGDQGSSGVYEWKDEVLVGALRSVVQMGIGPNGVELNALGDGLAVAPASPDARGYLVFSAALTLVGGTQKISFKTRGMQVMTRHQEREATIAHLRRMLHLLETDGDPHGNGGSAFFAVWTDYENALCRTQTVKQDY